MRKRPRSSVTPTLGEFRRSRRSAITPDPGLGTVRARCDDAPDVVAPACPRPAAQARGQKRGESGRRDAQNKACFSSWNPPWSGHQNHLPPARKMGRRSREIDGAPVNARMLSLVLGTSFFRPRAISSDVPERDRHSEDSSGGLVVFVVALAAAYGVAALSIESRASASAFSPRQRAGLGSQHHENHLRIDSYVLHHSHSAADGASYAAPEARPSRHATDEGVTGLGYQPGLRRRRRQGRARLSPDAPRARFSRRRPALRRASVGKDVFARHGDEEAGRRRLRALGVDIGLWTLPGKSRGCLSTNSGGQRPTDSRVGSGGWSKYSERELIARPRNTPARLQVLQDEDPPSRPARERKRVRAVPARSGDGVGA